MNRRWRTAGPKPVSVKGVENVKITYQYMNDPEERSCEISNALREDAVLRRAESRWLEFPQDWCHCDPKCESSSEHLRRMEDWRYEFAEDEVDRAIERRHGLE